MTNRKNKTPPSKLALHHCHDQRPLSSEPADQRATGLLHVLEQALHDVSLKPQT